MLGRKSWDCFVGRGCHLGYKCQKFAMVNVFKITNSVLYT